MKFLEKDYVKQLLIESYPSLNIDSVIPFNITDNKNFQDNLSADQNTLVGLFGYFEFNMNNASDIVNCEVVNYNGELIPISFFGNATTGAPPQRNFFGLLHKIEISLDAAGWSFTGWKIQMQNNLKVDLTSVLFDVFNFGEGFASLKPIFNANFAGGSSGVITFTDTRSVVFSPNPSSQPALVLISYLPLLTLPVDTLLMTDEYDINTTGVLTAYTNGSQILNIETWEHTFQITDVVSSSMNYAPKCSVYVMVDNVQPDGLITGSCIIDPATLCVSGGNFKRVKGDPYEPVFTAVIGFKKLGGATFALDYPGGISVSNGTVETDNPVDGGAGYWVLHGGNPSEIRPDYTAPVIINALTTAP